MAWAYADYKDKSTEWMLQYMADFSGQDYDDVVDWIQDGAGKGRKDWYFKNQGWLVDHDNINELRISLK
tara:strand:- start:5428 stop:5634 length:207 start_codon:yes stop_codon:yes gene_type:complete